MHVVKLRAWDIEGKKFIYSDNRDLETQLFRLHDFFRELMRLGEYNMILQQSTGLFDKNGREIYEGDFLAGIDFPIYFESGCFWIQIAYDLTRWTFEDVDTKEIEVIGNSYENPELAP